MNHYMHDGALAFSNVRKVGSCAQTRAHGVAHRELIDIHCNLFTNLGVRPQVRQVRCSEDDQEQASPARPSPD